MPPVVLVALALATLLAAFLASRRSAGRAGVARGIAAVVLAFLLAELLLALGAPRADAPRPWSPRGLDPVGGHRVPADLGARRVDATTVVVVGDSFAAGQGVDERDAFPRVLDRALGAHGHDARVRLLAMPGWGFPDELLAYDALGAPLDPDVVVWTFVLNDLGMGRHGGQAADLVLAPDAPASGSHLLDAWRAARHAAEVDARSVAMYRDALAADAPALAAFNDALRALGAETRGRGGRFVLAIFPLLDHLDAYRFEAEHARLRAAGEAAGVEVVDLLDAFRGRDARALWVSSADHHPNAAGHQLAADALRRALEARPLPTAGPVRCDTLPVPDEALAAPLRAACATPDGASALALADALLARQRTTPAPTCGAAAFAAHLAVVAAARGADVARAEAIVADARALAPDVVAPPR